MYLQKVSGCDDGTCPAVYISDRTSTVIQGEHVATADGLALVPGEAAVELPLDVVLDAVHVLAQFADPTIVRCLGEALACSWTATSSVAS